MVHAVGCWAMSAPPVERLTAAHQTVPQKPWGHRETKRVLLFWRAAVGIRPLVVAFPPGCVDSLLRGYFE